MLFRSALEQQAKIPSSPPLCALLLINHDRVQQPLAANFLDPSSSGSNALELVQTRAHDVSEALGARAEVFVDDDFERGSGDGASEGVLRAQWIS